MKRAAAILNLHLLCHVRDREIHLADDVAQVKAGARAKTSDL